MRDTAEDQMTGWVGDNSYPFYVPGLGEVALPDNARADVQEALQRSPESHAAAEKIVKAADPRSAAREQMKADIEAAHAGRTPVVFSGPAKRAARRAHAAEDGVYNALPGKRTGWSRHVAAMIARGGSHAEQVKLFMQIAQESADAADVTGLSGMGEGEIDPESIVTADQALPAAAEALAVIAKTIEAEALAEVDKAQAPAAPVPTTSQKAAAWSLPLVAVGVLAVMLIGQKRFK